MNYGHNVHTANNSYSINTTKQNNTTAHLSETLTYLNTFASLCTQNPRLCLHDIQWGC